MGGVRINSLDATLSHVLSKEAGPPVHLTFTSMTLEE